MRIIIPYIFVVIFSNCFSQDYLNYSQELLISRLTDLDFDTIVESEKQLIIDSISVNTLFNKDKCTQINYYIDKQYDSCDSIVFSSSCSACFESTLNLFLESKRRSWRKENDTVFYSVKGSWKNILFGPPRTVSFNIVKLETVGNSKFYIYRVIVAKEEYKRLRKMEKYR